MPVLSNPKHEHFCQLYARYGNATRAYVEAGYAAKSADSNAAILMGKQSIKDRVREIQEQVAAKLAEITIGDRMERVRVYDDTWKRLRLIADERANDPAMATIPGGKSGFLVKRVKSIGSGEFSEVVEEYEADTSLAKEIRATAQQAAQDLGQWLDKSEVSGKDGAPFQIIISSDDARL